MNVSRAGTAPGDSIWRLGISATRWLHEAFAGHARTGRTPLSRSVLAVSSPTIARYGVGRNCRARSRETAVTTTISIRIVTATAALALVPTLDARQWAEPSEPQHRRVSEVSGPANPALRGPISNKAMPSPDHDEAIVWTPALQRPNSATATQGPTRPGPAPTPTPHTGRIPPRFATPCGSVAGPESAAPHHGYAARKPSAVLVGCPAFPTQAIRPGMKRLKTIGFSRVRVRADKLRSRTRLAAGQPAARLGVEDAVRVRLRRVQRRSPVPRLAFAPGVSRPSPTGCENRSRLASVPDVQGIPHTLTQFSESSARHPGTSAQFLISQVSYRARPACGSADCNRRTLGLAW